MSFTTSPISRLPRLSGNDMKVTIIAVASRARGWAGEAEVDFCTRLRPFADLTVVLVKPEDEVVGIEVAKQREGERILTKIPDGSLVVACDRVGKMLDSVQLAQKIRVWRDASEHVCILIGGSHGFSADVLAHTKLSVSFGAITLPHELFRIVFLEQLYRGFMILAGKKYHK